MSNAPKPRVVETIDADLFDITSTIIDTLTVTGPRDMDAIHLAMQIAKDLRKEGLV